MALTPVALLIGLARVWTGVHNPGEILAAVAALFVLVVLQRPARLESAMRPAPRPRDGR